MLVCFPALSNDSSPADYSSLIRQRRLAMAEADCVSVCAHAHSYLATLYIVSLQINIPIPPHV